MYSEQVANSAWSAASLPKRLRIDGRALRRERTKQLIIEAYLALLNESQEPPTAARIAQRAGYSVRSVFQRFDDLLALTIAAADFAFAEELSGATSPDLGRTRDERVRAHVDRGSEICERWMPLWQALIHNQHESELVRARIGLFRDTMWKRLALTYRVELGGVPEFERRALLIALEQLTDVESWGRLRGRHGLSVEEARDTWIMAIDRLLPPTPGEQREPPPV